MRIFIVTLVLSTMVILTSCGRLKLAQDAPRPIDSTPVIITRANSQYHNEAVNNDAMFARKPVSNGPIITSKPMFTVKKRNSRKRFEWFKEYKKTLPTGYRGMPKGKILKPPQDDTVLITSKNGWDNVELEDYPREEEETYAPINYPDVTVYPLEGDREPYTSVDTQVEVAPYKEEKFTYVNDVANIPGEVAEELFFKHASSKINKKDLNKLYDLSSDIAAIDGGVKVSVVGHASKRVYNVNDPILIRKINKKMSELRAMAVSKQLNKMGIATNMLIVNAEGADDPNPHPGKLTQEAADRRVDIYLY